MKIVVVASLAYSLVNFRGRLLGDMVAQGHEVIACAPDDDPAVKTRLDAMHIAYLRVPMARTGTNPLTDLRTLSWLMRLLRREKPDIVLAYTQKPIIYAGIASRLTGQGRSFAMVSGLGHVFSEGEQAGHGVLRRLVSLLYRFALSKAEAVFVFNSDDRAEMIRHHILEPSAAVVQVPGSGVDLTHYTEQPVPQGPPAFLMIARLLRNKGLGEFVEAARVIRAAHPEVQCRLLGPTDPGALGIGRDTIAAWQAEGVIDYQGETRDVRPHLAGSTVFVLPSWYREGLPRTILEAMATGRAVVTTDMPGCREPIIVGETGFLVPPRNATALADAMLHFVHRPGLAAEMGRKGRELVERCYAVERVNALLLGTLGLSFPSGGSQTERDNRYAPSRLVADGVA